MISGPALGTQGVAAVCLCVDRRGKAPVFWAAWGGRRAIGGSWGVFGAGFCGRVQPPRPAGSSSLSKPSVLDSKLLPQAHLPPFHPGRPSIPGLVLLMLPSGTTSSSLEQPAWCWGVHYGLTRPKVSTLSPYRCSKAYSAPGTAFGAGRGQEGMREACRRGMLRGSHARAPWAAVSSACPGGCPARRPDSVKRGQSKPAGVLIAGHKLPCCSGRRLAPGSGGCGGGPANIPNKYARQQAQL